MPFLEYISDEDLIKEVKYLLDKAARKRKNVEKSFNKNVIDPFGTLFEASNFKSYEEWRNSEMARQCQKTNQNHVGTFHQRVLGHVDGWEDLGIGGIVDLVNREKKIIAESKNKFNTVTGGSLSGVYDSLDAQVSPKHSQFKGFTAYFVNIIPKKPIRYNEPFTPSKKDTGARCAENALIRKIDGASFYHIVTGRVDALKELHEALPKVIEIVYQQCYGQKDFEIPDVELFMKFFSKAYE